MNMLTDLAISRPVFCYLREFECDCAFVIHPPYLILYNKHVKFKTISLSFVQISTLIKYLQTWERKKKLTMTPLMKSNFSYEKDLVSVNYTSVLRRRLFEAKGQRCLISISI